MTSLPVTSFRAGAPLAQVVFLEAGSSPSAGYAGRLLALLGATVVRATDHAVCASESKARGEPGRGLRSGRCREPDLFLSQGKATLFMDAGVQDAAEGLRQLQVAGALDATGALPPAPYPVVELPPEEDPAAEWGRSGAMWLTGEAEGPALLAPGWQAAYVRGAAAALDLLGALATGRSGRIPPLCADAPALLGERAALAGLSRRGRVSPGGASRLVEAEDGWIAVSLSRPGDRDLLPAWLGIEPLPPWSNPRAVWASVERAVSAMSRSEAVVRAQLLGLPAAVAASPEQVAADEQSVARRQGFPAAPYLLDGAPASTPLCDEAISLDRVPPTRRLRLDRPPLVADLSGLWAGPLCTSLLASTGARVVKVEGARRPDGARHGPAGFFDLLNAGKECLSLDLRSAEEIALLCSLIERADLVVESSRPRAMAALGIDPELVVEGGGSWLSVTGYGRTGPWSQWAALGDDSAAGSGIAALTGAGAGLDGPVFCGDAYADPLTGLHAAVAGLATLLDSSAHLVDIAMREVVSHMLGGCDLRARPSCRPPVGGSDALGAIAVEEPRARPRRGSAGRLGEDDAALRAEFGVGRARVPARRLARGGHPRPAGVRASNGAARGAAAGTAGTSGRRGGS